MKAKIRGPDKKEGTSHKCSLKQNNKMSIMKCLIVHFYCDLN
jgi:hypothetical protein